MSRCNFPIEKVRNWTQQQRRRQLLLQQKEEERAEEQALKKLSTPEEVEIAMAFVSHESFSMDPSNLANIFNGGDLLANVTRHIHHHDSLEAQVQEILNKIFLEDYLRQ